VINRGQSAGLFTYLTLLLVPTLLTVIVPIAFFGAALFTLNRLNAESELVVMWAAGLSRAQLSAPVLAVAAFAMGITYACGLYLMPLGQRQIADMVFAIRADIGTAILREGAFVSPSSTLTVFIREITPGGEFRGILVHDSRDASRPVTYLAEKGLLARTEQGPRVIMENGAIEQSEEGGARLSALKFDRYVFDLEQFAGATRASERDTSERFLHELFDPGPDSADARRGIYFAEAHNRLSSPLYCVLFALIALAAAAKGPMVRSRSVLRLAVAAFMGAGLRMVGYGAQGLAASNSLICALLYLLPLGGSAVAVAVLADIPLLPAFLRNLFARRPGMEAS
jgi:lipopolysaccharide export system permease protein